MVRDSFQEQLKTLRNDILRMGTLVENAIDQAITSLKRNDLDMAEKVVMDDEKIDRLELEIEKKCLSLLALQQPMARDLRFIGTALKINTDLERIGDYACNIAKIVLSLGDSPFIKRPLDELPRMTELAQLMIKENLKAYVDQDHVLAMETAKNDHEIDILYGKVFRKLIELMTEDKTCVKRATYYLLIARHLERIGDHATNLSEWIVYMVTGERLELNEKLM